MNKNKNIILIGPMGAGKTSIGKQIAKELKMNFYDSDGVIEKRTGADVPWIFDLEGEEGFRKRETVILTELTQLNNIVLSTGGGAVALAENRILLAKYGTVIYLKTSLIDQLQRTGCSKKRPLAEEESKRRHTLSQMRSEHEPFYEELADIIYDTDDKTVRFAALEIIKILRKNNYL